MSWTEEELKEHKRIALTYRKKTIRANNAAAKDLSTKIWLMHEAIRSLPPNLREQAEILDEGRPPPDRPVGIYDTPPIKDFDPTNYSNETADDIVDSAAADDIFDPANDENVFRGITGKK